MIPKRKENDLHKTIILEQLDVWKHAVTKQTCGKIKQNKVAY